MFGFNVPDKFLDGCNNFLHSLLVAWQTNNDIKTIIALLFKGKPPSNYSLCKAGNQILWGNVLFF